MRWWVKRKTTHHRRPTFNCEMQNNAFGVRALPGPSGGAYTALLQTSQLDLKRPTFKGEGEKMEGGKVETKGKGREGGKGVEKGPSPPPEKKSGRRYWSLI